jgi:glycosyltransferase involved in cell wall biosynthesis
MIAGINQSTGDAVVFIDADLLDQPELIPHMVSTGSRAEIS